jgi:Sel1 repeat
MARRDPLQASPSHVRCRKSTFRPGVPGELSAIPFDPVASFHLGRALYKAGAFSNALLAFHVAANAGVVPALFNIGFIYNFGAKGEINSMSVPEDDQEAAKWYRKAVDAGDVGAMNNLGVMYRKGQGVPQDEAEAMRLFQKAADAGNAEAKDNLKAPEQRDNTTPEQHDNAPPEQHDNGRDDIAD